MQERIKELEEALAKTEAAYRCEKERADNIQNAIIAALETMESALKKGEVTI